MDDQLSPSKILLRLEELKKWQKLQEERLLEQQMLQRRQLAEAHNKFLHETISSQYDTFDSSSSECFSNCNLPKDSEERQVKLQNLSSLVDGVSALNISRESEPILSPVLSSAVESVQLNQSDPKDDDNMIDIPVNLQFVNQNVNRNRIDIGQNHFENGTKSRNSFENGTKSQNDFKNGTKSRNSFENGTKSQNDFKNGTKSRNSFENETKSQNDFKSGTKSHNGRFTSNSETHFKSDELKLKKNVQIKIDEIPIIPKAKDFETLVQNTIKNDSENSNFVAGNENSTKIKRPFLKKGKGMSKYNMTKKDIGLTSKTLPWRKASTGKNVQPQNKIKTNNDKCETVDIENKNVMNPKNSKTPEIECIEEKVCLNGQEDVEDLSKCCDYSHIDPEDSDDSRTNLTGELLELLKSKQPWASVLTQEQEKYIKLLGQTSKYKQYFHSDVSSCSSTQSPAINKLRDSKEIAEQKMFEMLETKVNNSSFSSNGSFVQKIVNQNGADTPTLNREYLKLFPHLFNLKPNLSDLETNDLNSTQTSVDCQNNEDDLTDVDDYTESTDSEPTCKETVNKPSILTSTPNQNSQTTNNENKVSNSPKDKNKVIKIIISEENNHTDATLDDRTIIANDDSRLDDMTEKAEMLKARLKDLQNEIEVFKRENEIVAKLKAALEEDRENFLKEKADIERKINEDKIVSEYYLAEEREKLAKQKSLYDRHVKEMKNQSSRKDREEIANLKKEINDLKDLIKAKDAKNGASQARLRNQVKCFERDKEELKFENDKLKKENNRLQNANMRSRRLSNIKCLAEINRTLSQTALNNRSDGSCEDLHLNKTVSSEYYDNNQQFNKKSRHATKPTVIRHDKPFKRTKSAPNLTSRYAKYFSKRDEEDKRYAREELGYDLESDSDHKNSDDDFEYERNKSTSKLKNTSEYPIVDYYEPPSSRLAAEQRSKSEETTDYDVQRFDIEKCYKDTFNKKQNNETFPSSKPNVKDSLNNVADSKKGLDHVVIDREDGSKEVRFTNGNIKIISNDGNYSKFLYYNGDVKETFYREGTIKYFYKEVNVHHTTYKDGSQLLQFPDGQIERRYPDGSVESQMADGATRWARAGGVQEWKFPDGTVLVVSPQGDRTLRFPNGQIEVHTKEYKRREFPDGTVKVVYADGVVETRFANGRIRVKDKQDRIFLDSAGSQFVKETHHVS